MRRSGFEKEPEEDGSWVLPGVVSRKKQFIPALMSAYQELEPPDIKHEAPGTLQVPGAVVFCKGASGCDF